MNSAAGASLDQARVLVTGAGGFIGSHLVERLVDTCASVRAFIRYTSRFDEGNLVHLPASKRDNIEVVAGDLRDASSVRDASRGCSHIFHLGALIGIPYSYLRPAEVVQTNVTGTLNVLLAARDLEVERLVHTSTSEVYGTGVMESIVEEHPLQAQSPYSASKIGAEALVESFRRSFGIPATTVRPFNTFGPRQSARALIPTIISQALVSDRIKLGSTTPTRDYTYVTDTVDGLIRAGSLEDAIGEVIHLGSNDEISVGDIARRIFGHMGKSPDLQEDPERERPKESEVLRLRANNSKAGRILNWEPRVSLDDGLKETIRWIEEHLSLFPRNQYSV